MRQRRTFFFVQAPKGSGLLGPGTDEKPMFLGPSVGGWTTGRMAAGTNDEAGEQTQFCDVFTKNYRVSESQF